MLIAGTPEFLLFCLIFMRMSGFLLFNPVFGRRNIPAISRAGMVMILSVLIYTVESRTEISLPETVYPLQFSLLLLLEYVCGYLLGFIMVLFDFVLTSAGAIVDFQMGLSMATVYDPQNGGQVALSGQIFQIYYLLLFFAVNGHLTLIKIFLTSGRVVPYGEVVIGKIQVNQLVTLFTECMEFAVKLAFPIIAIEFLTEMAVGMLMKIIPQINLFVLNIELKVVIGILVLVFLISPIGDFLGTLITQMIDQVRDMLLIMGSA